MTVKNSDCNFNYAKKKIIKDTDKDGTFETYLDGCIACNNKFEFGNEISIR